MLSPQERLQERMNEIMRVQPELHLATVSQEGEPHAATVWFTPDERLERVFWLSAKSRLHSQHIDDVVATGGIARVAGSMSGSNRPSRSVTGLSFEGHAYQITDQTDKEKALGLLVANRVFFKDEVENYIAPCESDSMEGHGVYAAEVKTWIDFDGRIETFSKKRVEIPVSPPFVG
jgi:uncharacterized protein YhbP (UPF0306 family)